MEIKISKYTSSISLAYLIFFNSEIFKNKYFYGNFLLNFLTLLVKFIVFILNKIQANFFSFIISLLDFSFCSLIFFNIVISFFVFAFIYEFFGFTYIFFY